MARTVATVAGAVLLGVTIYKAIRGPTEVVDTIETIGFDLFFESRLDGEWIASARGVTLLMTFDNGKSVVVAHVDGTERLYQGTLVSSAIDDSFELRIRSWTGAETWRCFARFDESFSRIIVDSQRWSSEQLKFRRPHEATDGLARLRQTTVDALQGEGG